MDENRSHDRGEHLERRELRNFPKCIGNDQFRLREAFVEGGNILDFQPNAKFWAGERYYRRQHIEIDDFYPLDMSGYGGGIEDLDLRIGKMSVAFLAGARPDVVTQNGNYAKSNIDVRFYDLKGPAGLWAFWFDYAAAKGGTEQTGQSFRPPTVTRSEFATSAWNGMEATTPFPSSTAKARPAISARPSMTPSPFLKNTGDC